VALLRAVACGDEEALAALYDRHAGWLTVRMTRRCAMPDVVDQAVQDTFLAVWRKAGAYREGGDVAAFIWGIGIRRLIDAIRRENGARRPRWRATEPEAVVSAEDAVAALAFVPRVAFRPVTQAVPAPAWVAPAGHLLLALPVLAATGWVQLRIMAHTIPPRISIQPTAVYPLIAQLTGWCAITAAAAACVGRSRYADLGGAIAVPVSFGAIALAWYVPVSARLLAGPSATAHGVTIGWYVIASAAFVLTCAALRDQWHRYSRKLLMTFRLTGRCRGPRLAARRGRPIRCRAPGGGKTSG
jgi:hypothetical protein